MTVYIALPIYLKSIYNMLTRTYYIYIQIKMNSFCTKKNYKISYVMYFWFKNSQ